MSQENVVRFWQSPNDKPELQDKVKRLQRFLIALLNSLVVAMLGGWCLAPSVAAQTTSDFFNDSVLHEIRIDIYPSDWQTLRDSFRENTYYPVDMRWLFDGKYVEAQQVGIRSRGWGSRSPIKPGLLVDFDRYNTNQRFLGLRSVVLRNNSQDPSMLHESVTFQLMKELGISVPRTAYTRLYVNDEYMGLYMIVESIDSLFLKNHLGEDGGYLYKYSHGPVENHYLFEYLGSDPSLYCPQPFEPEPHDADPTCGAIVSMIRTINQASDAQFELAMSEYLNLGEFVIELAAEAYLAETDGVAGDFGVNNFYLYRNSSSNYFHIFPWDKNRTFWAVDRSVWQNMDENILSRRAFAIPALRNLFVETISRAAMIAGGPGGWLEHEIARKYNLIRDSARDDPNKQCDDLQFGGLKPCTNEDFEAAIVSMSDWARGRNTYVAAQISAVLGGLPTFGGSTYTILNRGAASFLTGGGSGDGVVGYARIRPDAGSATPTGLAIVGFREDGVLVSEAVVPASPLIWNGRIYAEVNASVMTGLAIANPNPQPATIFFYFTDSTGQDFGSGNTTIAAGGQITRFLNESPFDGGTFAGSFTFSSSSPVAAMALRGFLNERSSVLITTLPVADLASPAEPASLVPHFADGGGWSTQLILVNPSDETVSGTAEFWGQGTAATPAQPLNVTIDGLAGTTFTYSIPPRSSRRITSAGSGPFMQSGSVRLIANGRLPVAQAVVSFTVAGVTVTQAGVAAIQNGTAFRIYVEASGDSIQSGIAMANPFNAETVVTLEVTDLSGDPITQVATTTVPANGQFAMSLNQIPGLQPLPGQFQGMLRVSATSAPISVLGLRSRYNELGNLLLTTMPPVAEAENPASEVLLPLIVDAGGYSTQLVLYSGSGQSVTGALQYFAQTGQPLNLKLKR